MVVVVVELVETVKAPGMIGVTRLTGFDGESVFLEEDTLLNGFTDGSRVFVETFTF